MPVSEPPKEWQQQIHRRILLDDPTAFAELCERALPHLVSLLRGQFYQVEAHLHETVIIDCLLDYQRRPRRFNSEKLFLFAYLRMAVRRDMLNIIDKNRRRERRLLSIDEPGAQQQLADENDLLDQMALDEWLQEHTELSRQEILQALNAELSEMDKEVLLLMVDGVRESRRYAEVMNLTHLDVVAQRKEVKRAKDRLNKQLRRFGKRIDRH